MTSRVGAVRRVAPALGALVSLLLATGCGMSIPSDPEGTLDSVRGGTLSVGVVTHGDFVEVDGTAGDQGAVGEDQISGSEVDLVRGFADLLGAEIEFYTTGEEELVRRLDEGSVDLVVGGFTSQTVRASEAGLTRPYTEKVLSGEKRKIVILAPRGENAFISELEQYLDASGSEASR
ncbi:hypothetical protein BJH93_10905 [Kocuria polaris]|nr:hypothetical protein [Kocuria polaris]